MKNTKTNKGAMTHNVCSVNKKFKIQIRRYGEWFNTVCTPEGCLRMTSDDSAALFFTKQSATDYATERIHPDLNWRVVEA